LLQDFWKDRGTAKQVGTGGHRSGDVEGVVKAVDAKTGFVTISIGSDAGIHKGQTLEAYRLKPVPAYLGTIEVVDTKPAEAVARESARLRGHLEVGDRVASTLRDR